jgi:5'-deoxynucleotidase
MVPNSSPTPYRPVIGAAQRDPDLIRWVKAADTLDAYLKCAIELAVGNRVIRRGQAPTRRKSPRHGHARGRILSQRFSPQASSLKTLDEIAE